MCSSDLASAINLNTKAGQAIMSNAKLIENKGRFLADQKTDDTTDDDDIDFVADLQMTYTGCYNVFSMAQADDGSHIIKNTPVATFTLGNMCIDLSRNTRIAARKIRIDGEYAVNMYDFIYGYNEAMKEQREWECDLWRENSCFCDKADDNEACMKECYIWNGMTDCMEKDEDDIEYQIQRYLQCGTMEFTEEPDENYGGGTGANYYNSKNYEGWDGEYRVGPYCGKDGKSIYLASFFDEDCTVEAKKDGLRAYMNGNYGIHLPYSNVSLIDVDECMSCTDKPAQYSSDIAGEWNVKNPKQFCLDAYTYSARCEKSGGLVTYPSEFGCDFIQNYLPGLHTNSNPISIGKNNMPRIVAWLLAFSTCYFAVYAYTLYKKIYENRAPTGLSSQAGGSLA